MTAYKYPETKIVGEQRANSQMKKMYMKKVNNKDTVIAYPDYENPKMKLFVWNVLKSDQNIQTIEFEDAVSATITGCVTWGENKILMFGNPDQGNP